MSHQPGRRPPSRRKSKHGWLIPLFTAVAIGALLLSFLAIVIPAIFSNLGGSSSNNNTTIQVTPGAEEAQMRARLQKNPKDVDAMIILANLLANSGRGTESIQWYNKAIALKPDDESLRVAFGTVLMQYNYYLDSQLQLQKAHDLSPKDPQPLYLLGQLYEHETPPQPDKARQMYEEAASVQPDSVYANLSQDRIAALSGTPQATPGATP